MSLVAVGNENGQVGILGTEYLVKEMLTTTKLCDLSLPFSPLPLKVIHCLILMNGS